MARTIGRHYPAFYYDYLNSLAVELGEVGRIEEARNVCRITLASPLAAAYPNWLETSNEIEAKRAAATSSFVAVSRNLQPKIQALRKVKPVRHVAFIPSASEGFFVQRSVAIVCAAVALIETVQYFPDRVRYSIIVRGPPACF